MIDTSHEPQARQIEFLNELLGEHARIAGDIVVISYSNLRDSRRHPGRR